MSVQLNREVVSKHLAPPVHRVGSGAKNQWHVYAGIGFVVAGLAAALLIADGQEVPVINLKNDISLFALFFILASAIQSLMEPFTPFLPGQDSCEVEATAVDKAVDSETDETPAEKELTRRRRSVLLWGIASCLAMVSCAYLGLFLLHTIGAEDVPLWIDIAITGLAIGAGTKPLHDMIKKIEASKKA